MSSSALLKKKAYRRKYYIMHRELFIARAKARAHRFRPTNQPIIVIHKPTLVSFA